MLTRRLRDSLNAMNAEFHYYSIYALALEAGFSENDAGLLAGSSQYVDNAMLPYVVETAEKRVELIVTQNYLFWNDEVRRDIYLPFHFIPGNERKACESRQDGRSNRFNVVPNGPLVKDNLIAALQTRNLYRIGIALHSFADSWAHQNFSGLVEDWNDFGQRSSSLGIPAAGHLHAFSSPDQISKIWNDPRLTSEKCCIDNNARFLEAARKIYRYLCIYMKKSYADEELVLEKLTGIWQSASTDERLADYVIAWQMPSWSATAWQEAAGIVAPDSAFSGMQGYDKLSWVTSQVKSSMGTKDEALRTRAGPEFFETTLYNWNLAAVAHQQQMQSVYEREGLLV